MKLGFLLFVEGEVCHGPAPMLMVSLSSKASRVPDFVRADGSVRVVFGAAAGGALPLTIAESGGYRVRFPRTGEGVLINTGGGIAGGDRMNVRITAQTGADAVVTTQAAEKVYRSEGTDAEIAVALALESKSRLAWLPQEQILFDGARLARTLDVSLTADASLTLVESVVFGRLAMGETMRSGRFRDRWRIRRDGRLVFAEDVHLEGAVTETLARRAVANDARSLATFLHIAPDAERLARDGRGVLAGASCECGLTAFDGMVLARFLSPDPQVLRTDLARFVGALRGGPMPRSWQT
jgi:urease accessory protein